MMRKLVVGLGGITALWMLVVLTTAVVLFVTRHHIPEYWRPMVSP